MQATTTTDDSSKDVAVAAVTVIRNRTAAVVAAVPSTSATMKIHRAARIIRTAAAMCTQTRIPARATIRATIVARVVAAAVVAPVTDVAMRHLRVRWVDAMAVAANPTHRPAHILIAHRSAYQWVWTIKID